MQTLRPLKAGIQLPDDVKAKGYKQVRPYHWEQVFYSPSLQFEGTEEDFIQAGHGYRFRDIDKFRRLIIQ